MTLDELLLTRRSIRHYKDIPVEDDKLLAVLEAGRLAPSAKNAQNWRFVAVKNASLRQDIQRACFGQNWIGNAPVTLVLWSADERVMTCGQSAASVDCSIALSFMLLKAWEQGLGTCWIGSFEENRVKNVLGLPPAARVVALTPLGYPDESPAARGRLELGQIADIRE